MTKPRLRRVDSDNGTWIGGLKDSCHRYQPRSCYNDFCSEGDFFHTLNSPLRRGIGLFTSYIGESTSFFRFFGVKFPKKSDFSLVRGTCSWGNMQPELSQILLVWQYAELRTKVALGWRALPRPEAAKLCLLPDVERAFSEAHRQNSTNICLSSVVIFLTRKIQPRYGGSKASIDRHQFAAWLPDKWIGSALGSDFCWRAVAGKNGDVVAEGK